MNSDFVSYRKFTNVDAAKEVMELLTENDIECHLQDNTHAYVKIVGYNQIDIGISLNIQGSNFEKADKILETYYDKDIDQTDKSYYLFDFSDDELKEIVENPYDWGQFDQQLAKKILKEKGIDYSDTYIQNIKNEKTIELSQVKKVPVIKLIAGYIFSILLPPIGLLIAVTIIYNRNLLPNGERFYVHPASDRMQGKIMAVISILLSIIIVLRIV